MDFTELEILAMHEKELNPQSIVHCPRCGRELQYREVGNSYEVKCQTEGCLKMTVRGL